MTLSTKLRPVYFALVLALGSAWVARIPAQEQAIPESAEAVLRAYRKMDSNGGRLTEKGWYDASKFFVRPERPAKQRAFQVVYAERFDRVILHGSRASGSVLCSGFGQIDTNGRFSPRISPPLFDSKGVPIVLPRGEPQISGLHALPRLYSLVLTNTYWEFGPQGEDPRQVKGPAEWKIDGFDYESWITIDAAIDYLSRLQRETVSQVVRHNASNSIAILRDLSKQQIPSSSAK
jgi:hypothetical protein